MEIPNYKNFKYTLTKEEKEKYKDLFNYEIIRIKYFESFSDTLLNRLWPSTRNFICGDKPTGDFVKLKLKIKKRSAINPKIIASCILEEMVKRELMVYVNSHNTPNEIYDFWMQKLKDRNICG